MMSRQLASKKSLIEIELNQNLRRKLLKLKSQLDALADACAEEGGNISSTQANTVLITRRTEHSALLRSITLLSEKLSTIESEIDQISSDLLKKNKELENEQARSVEDNRGLARSQKNVERYLAKRQILLQRRDESSQKVRDLGVLPEEAYVRQSEHHPTEKVSLSKLRLGARG